jgi:hypothetical protein
MVVVMYVVRVPNRGSPPAILLRESYREAGKVKNRTLASLSSWPEAKVEALARVLKGQPPPAAGLDGAFEITRSLPHGHVAAVLGTARQLGLEELIDPVPSRRRDLVTAMAVAQVIAPDSKLAIARGPGLDHRAARPAGRGAGPGRGPAAVAVRCHGPGRDHLPELPRRAAGGLHEPVPGSRAGLQAGIAAHGHRS